MKNSIGTSVVLTLAGESHGPEITAILDGMAPGIPVSEDLIAGQLALRRPAGPMDTSRREMDDFRITSGVYNGYTTGAPITIVIPNNDVRSVDYAALEGLARPSHADYTAHVKYGGFEDPRGGGHFSGRITAGIVAAGAIAQSALSRKGIRVGTHILECAGVKDVPFSQQPEEEIDRMNLLDFPVISDVRSKMEDAILAVRGASDSAGGIVQTAISGLPAGVGEPRWGSLDGVLAGAVMSIGGIKGIEFGSGFDLARMKGSEANDALCATPDGIRTLTNHSGGINGGISNGMPVVFNAVVKPTPSIAREQKTVNMTTGKDASVCVHGRHDPAIVRRVCIVVTSIVSIVLCDMLALRFGTDYLK